MNYKIFKDGAEINTIVADAEFVNNFCTKNGYTFEEVKDSEPAEAEPTTEELVNLMLGVNRYE